MPGIIPVRVAVSQGVKEKTEREETWQGMFVTMNVIRKRRIEIMPCKNCSHPLDYKTGKHLEGKESCAIYIPIDKMVCGCRKPEPERGTQKFNMDILEHGVGRVSE